MIARSRDRLIGSGTFLLVLAVYTATSPGRIDIIDGQARYEVALRWLTEGRPVLRDPVMVRFEAVQGADGQSYSFYGPAGSVFSMPLIAIGAVLHRGSQDGQRFMFSLTSAVFGAATAWVLYFFYRSLGLSEFRSWAWTMANAFATMLWPASTSTFDNAQHAFVAIVALFLAFISARNNVRALAAVAGLVAGILVLYQDYLILIMPALALATVAEGNRRDSLRRFLAFLGGALLDVALLVAYNYWRYGSILDKSRQQIDAGLFFGNPMAGSATLLVSPGKSIFLYSPLLIVGVLGFRQLWRDQPALARAIAGTSGTLVFFLSFIRFVGGDWCWGPRYLTVLIPLWALAMPFAHRQAAGVKRTTIALVVAGMVVQFLALSVEHQRFFFEEGLRDFFWADDRWFYFKRSALLARPGEVATLWNALPEEGRWFNPIQDAAGVTYSLLGPPLDMPRNQARQWMRQYTVFYLPRPWPIWMWWTNPTVRPINVPAIFGSLVVIGAFGTMRIWRGFHP